LPGEQDFIAGSHDSFDANSLVMVTLRQATSFGVLPIVSTVIEFAEMALTVPITFSIALSALLATASISAASRNISTFHVPLSAVSAFPRLRQKGYLVDGLASPPAIGQFFIIIPDMFVIIPEVFCIMLPCFIIWPRICSSIAC
jgi:hypothetical protein